jgi:uncharacterized membrane protein YphA (DoxX/SURF4 family)
VNDVASAPLDSPKPRRFGRPAEILVGVVFVVSAVLKAVDINTFIAQVERYGVMVLAFQAGVALWVLFVETSLGVLLLLGLWRRFTLASTLLMLFIFTVVVLYGWLYLRMDDCGCMGILPMPPWVSLIKNIVLIMLTIEAWRDLVPRWSWERSWRYFKYTALALIPFVAAGAVAGYAAAHVDTVQHKTIGDIKFEANGRTWDLSEGEYFVVVLSVTCPHCHKTIAPLNELSKREGFPPVVGLCKRDTKRYDKFVNETKPEFPLQMIEVGTFWKLVGFAFPRFMLVRDGAVLKVWDGQLPPVEEIEKARQTTPAM